MALSWDDLACAALARQFPVFPVHTATPEQYAALGATTELDAPVTALETGLGITVTAVTLTREVV